MYVCAYVLSMCTACVCYVIVIFCDFVLVVLTLYCLCLPVVWCFDPFCVVACFVFLCLVVFLVR